MDGCKWPVSQGVALLLKFARVDNEDLATGICSQHCTFVFYGRASRYAILTIRVPNRNPRYANRKS